jgi:hypothetical protein
LTDAGREPVSDEARDAELRDDRPTASSKKASLNANDDVS